ncbi:MAG: cytochrome ubiquinol oxidase subunit I [Clostridiales bacterium]|jgi:cytochrome d ubiquinol oxidase subunit I|nr:cytochrome ubiquinol oxidase subunit I [Clostridiales bacterium]
MDVLILARLQFAITTVFHFFFVPLSIGLALFIAILQTRYKRTGDEKMKQMVKFWGKIFLINFAMGVATGIVQEFQFGMNWSEYSRYVGDIFGAPLAIEALLAFFIESTFLGLWIFGWEKLSKKLHLACIWLVAVFTTVSAFWILTANSFMQNPVGFTLNSTTGRAELTSFTQLIGNPHTVYQFSHVFFAALATAGFLILGVCAYQLIKGRERDLFTKVFKQAAVFAIIGSLAVAGIGHFQGIYLVEEQPMKMAAADAHWNTADKPDWPIIAIPNKAKGENALALKVPGLLSLLSYNKFGQQVDGINDLQKDMAARFDQATYGTDDFIPNVWITFYAFRFMLLAGLLMILMAILALAWKQKLLQHAKYLKLLIPCILLPFIANTGGWLVAEVGRQPWIVYELQTVSQGVSRIVSAPVVLLTLLGFTAIYSVLLVIAVKLVQKTCRDGMSAETNNGAPPAATAV